MDNYHQVKRPIQIAIGSVVALVGIGLLGFTAVLVYAEMIRDPPSELAVNLIIGLCGLAGLLCVLVGTRLVSGKATEFDRYLLSPTAWRIIGLIFIVLSLPLLLRGRLAMALPGLIFGALCFLAGRSVLLARLRHSGR